MDGEEESMTGILDLLQHCLDFSLSEGKGAAEREGEPSADILVNTLSEMNYTIYSKSNFIY